MQLTDIVSMLLNLFNAENVVPVALKKSAIHSLPADTRQDVGIGDQGVPQTREPSGFYPDWRTTHLLVFLCSNPCDQLYPPFFLE